MSRERRYHCREGLANRRHKGRDSSLSSQLFVHDCPSAIDGLSSTNLYLITPAVLVAPPYGLAPICPSRTFWSRSNPKEEPELVRRIDSLTRSLETDIEASSKVAWHPHSRASIALTAIRGIVSLLECRISIADMLNRFWVMSWDGWELHTASICLSTTLNKRYH